MNTQILERTSSMWEYLTYIYGLEVMYSTCKCESDNPWVSHWGSYDMFVCGFQVKGQSYSVYQSLNLFWKVEVCNFHVKYWEASFTLMWHGLPLMEHFYRIGHVTPTWRWDTSRKGIQEITLVSLQVIMALALLSQELYISLWSVSMEFHTCTVQYNYVSHT